MFPARLACFPLLALSATTFACGSSDEGGDTGTEPDPTGMDPTGMDPTAMDPTAMDPTGMDPTAMDPLDREWAPGTADPCEGLDTGYANDELCLKPPPADVGFQVHFGPSDHDNPDDVSQFLLPAGSEDVVCQYRFTPDFEGTRYTSEQHTRLRQGTHHMIMWTATTDLPNAPADGELRTDSCQNPFEYIFSTGSQAALGEKGGVLDIPLGSGDPPENEGSAKLVAPNRSVAVEMHYVNPSSEPILREGWINTIYADPDTVQTLINPMFFIGAGMNVPPGGSQLVQNDDCEQPAIPADSAESQVRILGMTGHAHANTTRVTAWVNRAASGEREVIYETYDWSEPINAQFSSQDQNPPIGDGINDGAHSGIMALDPGDTFGWECQIENQSDVTLRFGNLAYEAEMCNIFGFMVPGDGGMWACFR